MWHLSGPVSAGDHCTCAGKARNSCSLPVMCNGPIWHMALCQWTIRLFPYFFILMKILLPTVLMNNTLLKIAVCMVGHAHCRQHDSTDGVQQLTYQLFMDPGRFMERAFP